MREDPIIELKGAVLRYPLGSFTRKSIKTAVLSRPEPSVGAERTFVEALSNVSFTVGRGERVGIIGRNGAGKSTVLRAIAGIYPLAAGSVTVKGRIRGLYDLSVGFELEEPGRRNIYYRGFLLGYSRSEIDRLEDEIIEFADIGDFIDLPMKAYSAGMSIRLAFAISTVLGGDALLIDEVLAAGDAEFAGKAAARMRELIDRAACMVLVSHDLAAIREICNRAIWLDHGQVVEDGPVHTVVDNYSATAAAKSIAPSHPLVSRSGSGQAGASGVHLLDAASRTELTRVVVGQQVILELEVDVRDAVPSLVLGVILRDHGGHLVWGSNTRLTKQVVAAPVTGERLVFEVPFACTLGPGTYALSHAVVEGDANLSSVYEQVENSLVFEVVNAGDPQFIGSSQLARGFVVKRGTGT